MNRQRRNLILNPDFQQGIQRDYPGTIQYWWANDGATVQPAYNRDVTGLADSRTYPGAEVLGQLTGDPMHVSNWTPIDNATLSNPEPGVLRIARNGTNNPSAQQNNLLTIGDRYFYGVEGASDGNATPRTREGSRVLVTGDTSTSYQDLSAEFVAQFVSPGLVAVTSTGTEYCDFRLASIKEANPLNADATGATPAQTFSPPQLPYAWSLITDDKLTVLGSALAAGFSLAKCEILTFNKMRIATATVENLFRITAGTDLCEIRNSASGELTWRFKVGAVDEEIIVGSLATDEPFAASIGIEDGDNGDFVVAKFNGVQVGISTSVGFGTVATITDFTMGAAVSAQYLDGLQSLAMLVPGGQLSDSAELDIVRRSGII